MTEDAPRTRRSFLRLGATVAGAGLAATSGCVELLPPLGQRVQFGRVEVPEAGPPAYRRLVPAGSALPDDAREWTYPSQIVRPGDDGSDELGTAGNVGRAVLRSQLDYFGVGIEHYDRAVSVGPVTALEGPVDADAVGDVLTTSGYERAGSLRSAALYERDDVPRTVAVEDGRLLFGTGEDREAYLEAVLDAAAGRVQRRHETDEDFAALTERLGDRPFLLGSSRDTIRHDPGEAGSGARDDVVFALSGMDWDRDAAYWLVHVRYAEGVDVPAAELREALRSNWRATEADGVDFQTTDRDAIVQSRVPAERIRDRDPTAEPPQITWGVRERTGGIVFRHEAGDAVDAERLRVVVESGFDEDEADAQFADEHDVVARGAELSVDVPSSADQVRIEWEASDGRSSGWLFRYEPD